ncbi:MAG: hypothetical protein AAFQ74_09215 [Cyanobacteria bacterium J06623_4]
MTVSRLVVYAPRPPISGKAPSPKHLDRSAKKVLSVLLQSPGIGDGGLNTLTFNDTYFRLPT